MTKTKPIPTDYMPQLDALRFIAALGVMVTHNWHPRRLPWILEGLDWGGLGVRLFFVLSGFLITGILLKCRDLSENTTEPRLFFIKRFYWRRFLRIFPVYYLVIALALVMNVQGARDVWPWLLTYTTNFYITFSLSSAGTMGHLWTLAVEEHFYLFWPWLVIFAPRKWLVPAISLLVVMAPVYRFFAYISVPFDIGAQDFKVATLTIAMLDSLGIGALLSLLRSSDLEAATLQRYLARLGLPAATIFYVLGLVLYHYRIEPAVLFIVGDTAVAVIFAWLVNSAAAGFPGFVGRFLELRPLSYLGKVSYGIYLYHRLTPLILVPMLGYFDIPLQVPGRLNFVLSALLTIVVASISWHLLEMPINKLKRHFPYAPMPAVITSEQVQPRSDLPSATV